MRPGCKVNTTAAGQVAAQSDAVAEAERTSIFFKMAEVLLCKCAICGCICSALVITLFDPLDYRNNAAQVVKGFFLFTNAIFVCFQRSSD